MKKLLIDVNSALRCVGKHKILYLVLVIQCILAFLLSLLLSQTYITSNKKYVKFNNLYGDKYYYYVGEITGLSSNNEDSINQSYFNIANSIKEINKSKDYKFISLINCNIDIQDKTFPVKFSYGYSWGCAQEAQTREGHTYQSLDYVGLSPTAFKEFDIEVESGQAFNDADFNYHKDGITPVLLGSEFKDYFKIGDKFYALYDNDLNCQVVGFLKKNSSYVLNDKLTYLDRSIVAPTPNPSTTVPDETQITILRDQLSQALISGKNKNYEQTQKYVTSCCIKANSPNLMKVVSIDPTDSIQIIKSTKENLTLTLILTTALIIFTIISLSFALLGIIRRNYYEYGIYLTCGATLKSIFVQIAIYTVSILIISLIISVNILKSRLHILSANAIYITIGIAVIIFIIAVIPSFFAIKKLDVSSLIRGKE